MGRIENPAYGFARLELFRSRCRQQILLKSRCDWLRIRREQIDGRREHATRVPFVISNSLYIHDPCLLLTVRVAIND